jgi:hypothetical protein
LEKGGSRREEHHDAARSAAFHVGGGKRDNLYHTLAGVEMFAQGGGGCA